MAGAAPSTCPLGIRSIPCPWISSTRLHPCLSKMFQIAWAPSPLDLPFQTDRRLLPREADSARSDIGA